MRMKHNKGNRSWGVRKALELRPATTICGNGWSDFHGCALTATMWSWQFGSRKMIHFIFRCHDSYIKCHLKYQLCCLFKKTFVSCLPTIGFSLHHLRTDSIHMDVYDSIEIFPVFFWRVLNNKRNDEQPHVVLPLIAHFQKSSFLGTEVGDKIKLCSCAIKNHLLNIYVMDWYHTSDSHTVFLFTGLIDLVRTVSNRPSLCNGPEYFPPKFKWFR